VVVCESGVGVLGITGGYDAVMKMSTCWLEGVSSVLGLLLFAFCITLIIGSLLISFFVYLIFMVSIYTQICHL
jgi:hypothetical protein